MSKILWMLLLRGTIEGGSSVLCAEWTTVWPSISGTHCFTRGDVAVNSSTQKTTNVDTARVVTETPSGMGFRLTYLK